METLLRAALWYHSNWRLNVVFAHFKKTVNPWREYESRRQESVLDDYRLAKALNPRINSINAVLGEYLCEELGGWRYAVIDIDVRPPPAGLEIIEALARETPVMVTARGFSIWLSIPCREAPMDIGKILTPSGEELGDIIVGRHCAALVPSARMRSGGGVHIVHFHPRSTTCSPRDVECLRRPWSLRVSPARVGWDYVVQLVSEILAGARIEPLGRARPVAPARPREGRPTAVEGAVAPILQLDIGLREWLEALEAACSSNDAPRCVCWALFERHPHGERWRAVALATLALASSCTCACREWDAFMEALSRVVEEWPHDEGTTLDRKASYLVLDAGGVCVPRYRSIAFIGVPRELCESCPLREVCNGRSVPLRALPYIVAKYLDPISPAHRE